VPIPPPASPHVTSSWACTCAFTPFSFLQSVPRSFLPTHARPLRIARSSKLSLPFLFFLLHPPFHIASAAAAPSYCSRARARPSSPFPCFDPHPIRVASLRAFFGACAAFSPFRPLRIAHTSILRLLFLPFYSIPLVFISHRIAVLSAAVPGARVHPLPSRPATPRVFPSRPSPIRSLFHLRSLSICLPPQTLLTPHPQLPS
jgi:hypothetical protein